MSEAEGRKDIAGECEGLYLRQEDKKHTRLMEGVYV